MTTISLLPQAPVRDGDVCLTLLSDLSAMLPHDFAFDFHVEGFVVSEVRPMDWYQVVQCRCWRRGCTITCVAACPVVGQTGGKIAVLIDNSSLTYHSTQRCSVSVTHSWLHP